MIRNPLALLEGLGPEPTSASMLRELEEARRRAELARADELEHEWYETVPSRRPALELRRRLQELVESMREVEW